MKPLFKWMGGKSKLIKTYEKIIEVGDCEHFYDMFSGAGSLAMWAFEKFPKAKIHINEFNPFIIGLYKTIQQTPESFVKLLEKELEAYKKIPVEKELCTKGRRSERQRYQYYFAMRMRLKNLYDEAPDKDNLGVDFYVVQLILQRLSFGGAWQTTREMYPVYATPPGFMEESEKLLDDMVQNVGAFSSFIRDPRVILTCGDYLDVPVELGEKTFIFADPPYIDTIHKYASSFTEVDQKKLCDEMCKWSQSGAKVVMTNAPWDKWTENLPGFTILDRDYVYTGGRGAGKKAKELLIGNCLKKEVDTENSKA